MTKTIIQIFYSSGSATPLSKDPSKSVEVAVAQVS